jgi:hypothetical protein
LKLGAAPVHQHAVVDDGLVVRVPARADHDPPGPRPDEGVRGMAAPEPAMALGVEDRPIGGLGISLVRRLMDEAEYERREGRNRLRLQRRLVAIEG